LNLGSLVKKAQLHLLQSLISGYSPVKLYKYLSIYFEINDIFVTVNFNSVFIFYISFSIWSTGELTYKSDSKKCGRRWKRPDSHIQGVPAIGGLVLSTCSTDQNKEKTS
jgi:hypothetical protein